MTLEERQAGEVTIVAISGDITLHAGVDVLKDKVYSLLQSERRKVLFDLAGVGQVDSTGLGQLVHAHVTMSRHGGTLKLLNLTKRLDDLLVLTKLVTVFDIFDDEAEALASF